MVDLWFLWLVSLQSTFSGVSAEHGITFERDECNQTSLNDDNLQFLQTGRLGSFPSDCFVLEDHYHVHHGVLTATLRFGPGGNAGPSDIKCIASNKVTEIVGSISVTGALSFTSLLLPKLERVRGSLVLMQLPKLEQPHLDALKVVNENLVLRHNEVLSKMEFTHLERVDRTLEVSSNEMLETLSFNKLTFVGLHLLIESNPNLKMITASNLEEIKFDLIIAANNALTKLEFPVRKIGEDLVVYAMDDLKCIEFPFLTSVGEDMEFFHLTSLRHLTLPMVESIGEDFEVYHCYSLESISVPLLREVMEDVEMHHLPFCKAISMPGLVEIAEDLEMYNLDALERIFVPSLKIISEDLILGGMAVILDLSMPGLKQVGASFWLYNMPMLHSVDFASLAHVGGKDKSKKSHPSAEICHYQLGDCDKEDLEEDAFYVTNNTRLEHLQMKNLVSIRCRYFAIFGNTNLVSVELPLLTKLRARACKVSCGLKSLFGVFRNEELQHLDLNPQLPEPKFWTLEENAASFSVNGPSWAEAGGSVSVQDAETTIFGCECDEAGFEDSFVDGFCRQGQCSQYAAREVFGTCPTCYDADGCLVLSHAFATVSDSNGLAINGSILLTSMDLENVTCIKGGKDLTSINGCLTIQGISSLESIDLEEVMLVDSIAISGNEALHQIVASSLENITLDLVLQGNLALLDLHVPNLREVAGLFSIMGHPSLQLLECPALKQLGSFFLASLALKSLEIPQLQQTRSHIRIWQMNNITTMDFPALQQIGEDFMISFCWNLEVVNVLELVGISEDLELYVLHSLERITFPLLVQVGEDLEIYTNDALINIRFASLTLIGEDLEVFDNSGLFELDQESFPNLAHVEEDFEVYVCAQLKLLEVPKLVRIDEDFLLFGNPTLQAVELSSLEDIAAREGGGMLITDNLVLAHFALPSLRRVGNSTARQGSRDGSRDIRLYTGASPFQVRGVAARPILISHNPELLHITFPKLEILNTGLWIQNNEKLTSIALESLKRGVCGQFFVVRLNSNLGRDGLKVPNLQRGCAPRLANLNCNGKTFCVQNPGAGWLQPWSCARHSWNTCPDPYFANRWCGRSAVICTWVFYNWAMENSYDFEENVVQPWVPPSRFAAYAKVGRGHYGHYGHHR